MVVKGSLEGSAAIMVQPNNGEDRNSEGVPEGQRSYMIWSFAVLFTALLVILAFLTAAWLSLTHVALLEMPQTFAWEIVITFLGSYYNDSIQPGPLSPPTTIQPIKDKCSVNFSLPWIPVVGGMTSFVTFFVVSWAVTRVVYFQKSSSFWLKLLALLSTLGTMNWIISAFHFSAASKYKRDLKEHMNFTMNMLNPDQLPSEIYFRWNISQNILKCCGMFGAGDWQFRTFRNGDPRFPKSCCNKDADNPNFQCSQRRFPDRYHTWESGCYGLEANIVASYENWIAFLIILSAISAVLLSLITVLLAIFTKESFCPAQLFPRMKEIQVTLLRKSLTCRLDNRYYRKKDPVMLTSFKEITSGLSEFEDSKSDNDHIRTCKETSV